MADLVETSKLANAILETLRAAHVEDTFIIEVDGPQVSDAFVLSVDPTTVRVNLDNGKRYALTVTEI